MQPASLIAIYFIIWWLCLFLILPFGANSQSDTGEVEKGTEPGSPINARMGKKLAINTVFSAIVMALLLWGFSYPPLQEYWR